MSESGKWSVYFCIIVDVILVVAMVLIAVITKTAWGLVLIFALQKPSKDDFEESRHE